MLPGLLVGIVEFVCFLRVLFELFLWVWFAVSFVWILLVMLVAVGGLVRCYCLLI